MFRRILVPTDGSPGTLKVVDSAAEVAERFDGEIILLCVVDTYSDVQISEIRLDFREGLLRWGRSNVDEATERLRKRNRRLRVSCHVREGHPAEEILRFARENRIDGIVMGTAGRRGLRRFFLGSVAEEVARRAETALLLVRGAVVRKRKDL